MEAVVGLAALRVAEDTEGDIHALHLRLARRPLLRRRVLVQVRVMRAGEPTVGAGHLFGGRVRRDAEDRVGIDAARAGANSFALGLTFRLFRPASLGLPLGSSAGPLDPGGLALGCCLSLSFPLGRPRRRLGGTCRSGVRACRPGRRRLPNPLFLL